MKNLFTTIILVFFTVVGTAQNSVPPLERVISLSVTDMPVDKVLDMIAQKGKFSFSYNPKSFDIHRKISFVQQKKSVRFILNQMFVGTVAYKNRDNFIILSSTGKKLTPEPQQLSYVWVNGYTIRSSDSTKIKGASILEEKSLRSVVSDDYGYFSIQLPVNTPVAQLNIKKEGFKDTILEVERGKFQSVEIALLEVKPIVLPAQVNDTDTVVLAPVSVIDSSTTAETEKTKKPFFNFLLSPEMKTSLRNVTDTFFRVAQFSVVPGLSTNGLIGTRVVNNFSFNLLAGYTHGVKGAEIGGLVNINHGFMEGFQVAGLVNTVGGNVDGVQIGGWVNVVKGSVDGFQIGGLVNTVGGKMTGAQISGLVNFVNDTLNGCQIGGLVNVNRKHSSGFSLAGLSNYSKTFDGFQLGGISNYTHTMDGAQLSGIVNYATYINGSQIAGIVNYAGTIKGSQIAGVLNYARCIKGFQVGLINVADSCTGAAIGLLSFVKTGYHKIEISTDEVIQANLAFRTGTDIFHTMLGAGLNPAPANEILWTYMYGVGTSFRLVKTLWMDIDLSASHYNKGDHADYLNLNNKVYMGLDWRIAKKFSIAAGPTFNIFLTDLRNEHYAETFNVIRPSYIREQRADTYLDIKYWIGFKASVRFL